MASIVGVRRLTPTYTGWWGKQEMTDPVTGETKVVQLGSPRRLQIIYDTNLRTAYSAGRWERFQRAKDVLPYLTYRTMRDGRVRPQHQAWDGITLPQTHAWWDTHYPPNGWRCRCIAYGIDKEDAEKLQAAGRPIRFDAPPTVYKEWVNPRTGEIRRVPVGIDPGFDYNPGKGRMAQLERLLREKEAVLSGIGQNSAMASIANWQDLGLPAARDLRQMDGVSSVPPPLLKGAETHDQAIAVLREALGISLGGKRTIETPVDEVMIDDSWLSHIVEKRQAARERYAGWILPALESPTEVWLSPYGEGETRKRFIKLFADGGKDMLVVVKLTNGGVVWNAIPMPKRSVDNQRNGELLWRSYR